jgi:hypothetical protein
MSFFNFIKTRQPDGSGAEVYAPLPTTTLPLFTLPGPGTPWAQFWNPTQPPQLWYNLAQRMDGQIGIVAGQMALTPLIDNRGISG